MTPVHEPHPIELPAASAVYPASGVLALRRIWPALLLVVVAGGLLESGFASLPFIDGRRGTPWSANLVQIMPSWLMLGALVPLIFAWCRAFPLTAPWRVRNVAAHAVGAIAFPVVHSTLYVGFMQLVEATVPNSPPAVRIIVNLLRLYFGAEVLTYGAVVCLWSAAHYHHEATRRELDAIRLREALTRAQLDALRLQLQPHFLFNTLHSIASMAHNRQTDDLVRTVNHLGELLRAVLEDRTASEVSLAQEIALAERYLEVMRVRFQDRLTVVWDLDARCNDARIPVMLLQPILENALLHGIESRPGPGTVRVQTRLHDERVEVRIQDSGPGFRATPRLGRGVGLSNTRKRLELLWGERCRLETSSAEQSGGGVVLDFPFERHVGSGSAGA